VNLGSQPKPGIQDIEDAKNATQPRCLVPDGLQVEIVLGIDPGTVVLGYGALILAADGPRFLTAGVVKANPRWPIARRLGHMLQGLEEVYALTRPSFVAVETAFTHRNPKTAIRLGEARGVAIASAYQFGAEVHEVSPSEAKKCVTGNGLAAKEQVAAVLPKLLRLAELDVPIDATDALALAFAFIRRRELARLTR
jgi:crossover junction endodeoxyribonuclease RuvC